MSNELTVAVDFDNTMCAFCDHQREVIQRDFGITIGQDYDTVKSDVPWKDFGYRSWWDWLEQHKWLWALAPAEDGAVGAIARLRAQGHRPELVTAKPRWAEGEVWKWLSRWRPAFEGVRFSPIGENSHPGPKSEASDADVLIDDRVDVVQEWVQSDPTRFGVLYAQPWNVGFEPVAAGRIVKAYGWKAVLDTIDTLEEIA